MAVVVRDARDALTVQAPDGQTLAWTLGVTRMYGWSEAEARAMNVIERIPPELHDASLAVLARLARAETAETLEPYSTRRVTRAGATIDVSTALVNAAGETYAIATTERDSTRGAT